ncbi:PRC-barrel domain-containing protein [Phototrophicus methaneseepsis]|uniref:PRC-barrel domain-containing protein n=1 Tax=Phototrophicus methaneseepsis TaxID=2710758 RepID=A0A7S8E726_9CHLR|nr:PRC-barrel domain-containing protein [Phototrophicus methaneseepsis]QPC81542.1 PRC-barrel domain-containing protein [Phototrophicus methaneseepsis]
MGKNDIVRALSATSLNGTNVVNTQGEDIGHIEDLMIDLTTGRILYAVLSFGGILGIGNKLFAVPFQSFTIDQNNERFILDANKERLQNAPGFDKDHWPQTGNMDFQNEVYRYYDVDPYWNEPVR